MLPLIGNAQARRVFLARQGLCATPGRGLDRSALLALIEGLGFVQVDSINTVERAHHMILFCRNQTYRREQLRHLLERDRSLFENWTHDAAIIPTRFYPYWRHRFSRERERLALRWKKWRRPGFQQAATRIMERIRDQGELMSRDTAAGHHRPQRPPGGGGGWWDWHPSKTALEFLWRTGELAVSRREGFQKVYDLSQRVIPRAYLEREPGQQETVDWACGAALDRLGFATAGELAAFWDAVSPAEASAWAARQLGQELIQVRVEGEDGAGPRKVFARAQLLEELCHLPDPPGRLRLLSPFDPLLRDRGRAERLFGFRYRIEVFVPARLRRFGYYVFPILEGARIVGRIDLKLHRGDGVLSVQGLWWEPGIRCGRQRARRLEAELDRVRRFVGAERVCEGAGHAPFDASRPRPAP